jgi:Holliday junction DNA helicase RuvA
VIASLQGTLSAKYADHVEVDVEGVGYEAFVTARTLRDLPSPGNRVSLKTYLHVREDALQLYAFPDHAEKQAFQLLLSVSGVGPRVALSLLNQFDAPSLYQALARGESGVFRSVSGVGQKTAQHLVVELKDKAAKLAGPTAEGPFEGSFGETRTVQDAVAALSVLGYGAAEARRSVQNALQALGMDATVEELIRNSLKSL